MIPHEDKERDYLEGLNPLVVLLADGPVTHMETLARNALSHRGPGSAGWAVQSVAATKSGDSVTLRLAAIPEPEEDD